MLWEVKVLVDTGKEQLVFHELYEAPNEGEATVKAIDEYRAHYPQSVAIATHAKVQEQK